MEERRKAAENAWCHSTSMPTRAGKEPRIYRRVTQIEEHDIDLSRWWEKENEAYSSNDSEHRSHCLRSKQDHGQK